MSEMSIIDRLKVFMNHVGMSNSQFADAAGIPRPTLSQLLNGRNKSVNDAFLRKLNEAFPNLDVRWLLFGLGDMLVDSNIEISEPQNSVKTDFSEAHSSLFEDVESFDSDFYTTPVETPNNSNPQIQQKNVADGRPEIVNPAPIEQDYPSRAASPALAQTLRNAFGSIPGNKDSVEHVEATSARQCEDGSKKIASIIVLYSDNSFETFRPSEIK